jgi:type II secretory pathway predicted ATPase ExeA
MYESFFKFREQPFSLLPDLRFLYLGEPQNVVLETLERGLAARGGITVITGESGCGKTTLGTYLARSVGRGVPVESLSGARVLDVDLVLQALCAHATESQKNERSEHLDLFANHLLAAFANNQSLLLILDEVQDLGVDRLAQLHRLIVSGTEEDQLLYLVLFGQLDLKGQLAMPELEQIAGETVAGASIVPLNVNETQAYIRHRLTVAGGNPELFTLAACARVFDHTGGVAGLVNRLCELCLTYGYDQGRTSIKEDTVDEAAARGIQGVPFWDAKTLLTEPGDGGQLQTAIRPPAGDQTQMLMVEKSANGPRHERTDLAPELDELERDLEQTAAIAPVDRSDSQLPPRARRELAELKQAIATLPTPPTGVFDEPQRADLLLVREERSSDPRSSEQSDTVVLPSQPPRSGTPPTIRLGVSEAGESAPGLGLPANPDGEFGVDSKAPDRRGNRFSKVLVLGVPLLLLGLVLFLVVDRVAVQSLVTRVVSGIKAIYDTPGARVVPPQETPDDGQVVSDSAIGPVAQPSTEIVPDVAPPSGPDTAPRETGYWITLAYEAWAASELELALQYVEQGLREDPDNDQLQTLASAVRADLKTESP